MRQYASPSIRFDFRTDRIGVPVLVHAELDMQVAGECKSKI